MGIMNKEKEPDYENVVYMDEYPHLTERRRVKQCLGQLTLNINRNPGQLLLFPDQQEEPDASA